MLLVLMNRLLIADAEVRKGIWRREANRGLELEGKTVGIIGYGNTGSAFAEKLSGFACRVLAYDKYKKGFSDAHVEESGMDRICREADILSLHVPLTEETTYLVDEQYLGSFSKDLFLLNTSRGQCVNTHDLVQAIESGKVKGAALDVLEHERASFEGLEDGSMPADLQYLFSSDKVILTPHIAGWTLESKRKLAEVILSKILSEFKPPSSSLA
jgi:D-3-phosphoglycerate dehydrogenase